jgi:hypothetical protein
MKYAIVNDDFFINYNKLMQRALIWLNLYGRQAVQRKPQKG